MDGKWVEVNVNVPQSCRFRVSNQTEHNSGQSLPSPCPPLLHTETPPHRPQGFQYWPSCLKLGDHPLFQTHKRPLVLVQLWVTSTDSQLWPVTPEKSRELNAALLKHKWMIHPSSSITSDHHHHDETITHTYGSVINKCRMENGSLSPLKEHSGSNTLESGRTLKIWSIWSGVFLFFA